MNGNRVVLALVGSFLFCASGAQGGPAGFGMNIPESGSMPNYWSGTNCRASGSAQIGEPIYAAQLLLNGEPVYDWIQPDPELWPLSMSLKVMFDSSHFADGTPVEVTYRVWGLFTGMHEIKSEPDPVVKNFLMMYEDPAPPTPDPVPTVKSIMSGSNFALLDVDSSNWDEDEYLGQLYFSSAVLFAGHGNPEAHSTPQLGVNITPAEYETAQIGHKGIGLPPFNSSGSPPVNFCHLVACNCGDTSDFKKVLYPYYMGWGGPYLENQALMAYTAFTQTSQRAKNAELIWEKLALGWTARATWNWFRDFWLPDHASEILMSDVQKPYIWRDMVIGDLALYCGPDNGAMRLKTVYTGDQTPPTSSTTPWFRPL